MRKGFTIVELLIVIVVIGILAAIVVATYNNIQRRAQLAMMQSAYREISQSLEIYHLEHNRWPECVTGMPGDGCRFSEINDQLKTLGISGLPERHYALGGSGDTHSVRYVENNYEDRWAIRFQPKTGEYCKMGHNMQPGWWSSAPDCW